MQPDFLAAVDLGSNSFHLQIGRVVDAQIHPQDAMREVVQLRAGLAPDGELDRATQLRALEALTRFGERLRGFSPEAVRAVGTKALRMAANAQQFLDEAQAALGFPIEIVFGREEARLTYLGVSHSLQPSLERRIVVDVGGGSTEFIIGTGFEPELMESLPIGCVSYSLRFFPEGNIDQASMNNAVLTAGAEIVHMAAKYRARAWKQAIASSGTARYIASILATHGWCETGISALGLERLRTHLINAGSIRNAALGGLAPDRLAILAGGVAAMSAIFQVLELHHAEVSEASLRQGVLYDLLARVQQRDVRNATVQHLMQRYQIDAAQARRVGTLARTLYDGLAAPSSTREQQTLQWAAQLHEVGVSIAYAAYHKHSAYILSNADMPGFSRDEQAHLARLVLGHRGKLGKLGSMASNNADWASIFSLRIAALIHRGRMEMQTPQIGCAMSAKGFQLSLPEDWLAVHPLIGAALQAEQQLWRASGIELEVCALRASNSASA
jgi:exopolyphosphatase/guanosine-5'-triphosphate,3'-diphosphate pyrophosphatase